MCHKALVLRFSIHKLANITVHKAEAYFLQDYNRTSIMNPEVIFPSLEQSDKRTLCARRVHSFGCAVHGWLRKFV